MSASVLESHSVDERLVSLTTLVEQLRHEVADLQSETSPAPNYAEARGAESSADFVHKLKISLKELNETSVWLRMICRADLMKVQLMEELIDENQQLCRILNSSEKTAKENANREKSS